ncbi:SDR family oxidoreductase [Lacisediminimonas profundi]|uniref:SDR family oxidoreductase n=1 Tax=Lacisediminimonas profundi TaxID=2603856 RepID=UPI00124AEC04|nr:SDR family oxidoreductase [Lacisediminimonas profundi]
MIKCLENQVVLVTGAGRGIGREIALLAAKEGASVVVNDLGVSTDGSGKSSSVAEDLVKEIAAAGGTAVANSGDITDPAQADEMVQQAISVFGKIDAVVNNAGFLRDKIFHKMSSDEWNSVIDVHLNGYWNVSRAAANYFREVQRGKFVHFTSTSGLIGNFGQANYASAKMGVVGLSKSIALDMERYNVRSNCIAPFAWSRMTDSIPADTPEEKLRVERLKSMSAEKIAPLAVFLASDSSEGVTGQIFGCRKNEIFLFDQPRPIRSVHSSTGWTADSLANVMMPSFKNSFIKLERSGDVFTWDPI